MQTGILLVVCFIGDFSEVSESKVGDLDHPATVQQTVGALQTTMKLLRTLVYILHSLDRKPRRCDRNCTHEYAWVNRVGANRANLTKSEPDTLARNFTIADNFS